MIESWFQLWALVALLPLTIFAPRWVCGLHCKAMALFARLGRRPLPWVLACGLISGFLSAIAATLVLWPEPGIHDEFSYLLAAETFASGRVTNPTHPLWEHFESFHIFHQPSYTSKYPPAQGLVLALGLVLGGDAAVGLWLQAAAMCAAIAWMLFGWLPGRWAVLGSLAALLQLGVGGPWAQSYWGGAVAATGGALVFGALPRILRRPRVRHAVILGIGLAILANSRPYEGLVASLPVAVVLVVWMIRNRRRRELRFVRRVVLPTLGILAVTAALMAYYNWRVTGDPLLLPYSLHDEQYSMYPAFLWEPVRSLPEFRHKELLQFCVDFQAGDYKAGGEVLSLLWAAYLRALDLIWFFFGFLLLVPLMALPFVGSRPRVALAVITCSLVFVALCATTYHKPHYAAPITCCLFLLVSASWRRLARLRLIGRRRAQALLVGVAVALLGLTMVKVIDVPTPLSSFGHSRAMGRDYLLSKPGRHLVIVSYTEGHTEHYEWVYNAAEIDKAPIVWARDMGEEKNRRLRDYFGDRHLWSLRQGCPNDPLELRRISVPGRRR